MDFIPVDTTKKRMVLNVCSVVGIDIESAVGFIARVHVVEGMLGCQAKCDRVIHAILAGGQAVFLLLEKLVYQVDCFSGDELIGWPVRKM